ncbi:hypothetical protein U8P75_29995 (plasmid) [Rhizobium beringeri]|nr:hypothetical protein U8P75_29995 [Rhizobium beringeri]
MALLFFVRISGRYSSGVGMVGNRIDETLRRRFRIQGNFIEYVARSILWPRLGEFMSQIDNRMQRKGPNP